MPVRPVPRGFHAVTPYLTIERAAEFLAFLKKAFDAKIVSKMHGPDGRLAHAEVQVGDSMLMVAQPMGPHGTRTAGIYLFVPDSDKVYRKAVAAGATVTMPLADQFWGDRGGSVDDPFGNSWWICTRKEDLSPKEIGRRAEAFFAAQAGGGGPEATSMKKKPSKSSESKVVAKSGARGRVDKKIEPPSVAARRRSSSVTSAIPTSAVVTQPEARTMENPGHMGAGNTAPPAPPPVWREEALPLGTPETGPIVPPTPRRRR